MRYEYFHKSNHSISFIPPLGCINHRIGITIPDMSHEPRDIKPNLQEPGGLTSDCLMFVPKDKSQNYNCQEHLGSTCDCLTLILNKICNARSQTYIWAPLNSNTYKTDITQKCNSLHQSYIHITEIYRHKNAMKNSL